MSISTKQLKEIETKIHDRLHENIKLLTHIYPTSKEFDSVLKKNMFAKSNKAAFQHVIYYLFTILDPALTKEKIKSWPLYDVKLEGIFRTEVVAFINCLKSSYVPNLIASQLVTPGGFKFAKFMLKLSNLVVHEHLKKSERVRSELLSPIRPSKNSGVTKIGLRNLKTKTDGVVSQVGKMCGEFHLKFGEMTTEADAISCEQTQINSDLAKFRNILKEKKCKSGVESLTDELNALTPRMVQMEKIRALCERCNDLLQYLSSDKPVLEFNKHEFLVPDSVKHLFKIDDELDLYHLFNSLTVLLENENLEMPVFTDDSLNFFIRIVSELNEKCSHLNQKLDSHKSELVEVSESFYSCVDEEGKSKKTPMIVVTGASESYVQL